MIFHLIYISEKTTLFHDTHDLTDILTKSQSNNPKKEVTGLLIKNGNFFIQVLEGKREHVMTLFNRISGDPRHMKVKILLTYQDSERIFPNWAMGLADNKFHEGTIHKLIPLLHVDVIKLSSSKDKVITLLKNFNMTDA